MPSPEYELEVTLFKRTPGKREFLQSETITIKRGIQNDDGAKLKATWALTQVRAKELEADPQKWTPASSRA